MPLAAMTGSDGDVVVFANNVNSRSGYGHKCWESLSRMALLPLRYCRLPLAAPQANPSSRVIVRYAVSLHSFLRACLVATLYLRYYLNRHCLENSWWHIG